MQKTRKIFTRKRKNTNRKSKRGLHIFTGGGDAYPGFPPCVSLAQFKMSEENISSFRRIFNSPMDCVITALQLFGILDVRSANLMRISSLGKSGFTKEQIELIFMYTIRKNFDFKFTTNFTEFADYIMSNLRIGYAVFAGYEGHVFIIAKQSDGRLLYMDPKQTPAICLFGAECQSSLSIHKTFFLLHSSIDDLTDPQQETIIEIVSNSQKITEVEIEDNPL